MTTWTAADTDALAELTRRKTAAITPLAHLVQKGLVTDHNTSMRIAEVLVTNAGTAVLALGPFLRSTPVAPVPVRPASDDAMAVLTQLDDYLRAIRSEELDGSEPELGALLERSRAVFECQPTATHAPIQPAKPTVDQMREKATILAALRFWQREGLRSVGCCESYIATDGGTLDPLDSEEIDALCERINTTGN